MRWPFRETDLPYPDEEWRGVVGFEDTYQVSTYGRIRRIRSSMLAEAFRIKQPIPDKKGYFRLQLYREGQKPITQKVHRLVATAFIGPPLPGQEVNHKDGDKQNNRPENLEWVTPKENTTYSIRNGNRRFANVWSYQKRNKKLTEQDVREIRELRNQGNPLNSIAQKYGVSPSMVSYIALRKSWRHII